MENINIIIPMAGEGKRFRVQGYNIPKPFIEFDNKMMIEHVLSSVEKFKTAKIFLIIQEKFLNEQHSQLNKLRKNYNIEFVSVPHLTMGAAITSLAPHNQIHNDNPVLFMDSDNIFNQNDITNFIKF